MDFFKKKPSEIAQEIVRREVTPLLTQPQDSHKHEWDLVSKTQAPARRDISAETLKMFSQADNEILNQMLFGVTVFLWECLLCRALRKESVLGSDITQLDELIDKSDKFGPQYIQRADGVTFVLTKYHPPQAQSAVLPLR